MERDAARVRVDQPTCPFCRVEIAAGEPQLACNRCRAWHHTDCWAENRSTCGSCGGQETGLSSAPPKPVAARPGPVRYRTPSGRLYEYRIPVGRWFLERLLLIPAVVLPFALLIAALPRRAEGIVAGIGVLMFASIFLALRWHERRSRRYV
jgi:hypothetical protein